MILGMPTTSYPRSSDDIAGDFVRGMARGLVGRGHEVHVLAPEPAEPSDALADPGIRLETLPYLRPRTLERTFYGAGVPDNVRADPRALLGLATFPPVLAHAIGRRLARWDAVISHWALPSALATGIWHPRIPHVAVMHSADVHLLAALPGRRVIARAVESSASSLWFVAPYLEARFRDCLGREPRIPVDVAPMGFEPARPPREPREAIRARLGLSGFTVLTMGRLVGIKGIDRLVDLARRLGFTLLVAGDGPERAALERRSVGADVRFLGTVRDERKVEVLAAADVFALASRELGGARAEGAPVSLLEAMDARLPVIVTATGGMPSLVGDAGLVADDDVALGSWLTRLRDDPDLRAHLAHLGAARARPHRWQARLATLERRLSPVGPRSSGA